MKKYKYQNQSQKNSHSCVPFSFRLWQGDRDLSDLWTVEHKCYIPTAEDDII
jgi:hypothetical protein